jgi:hypothetical protein
MKRGDDIKMCGAGWTWILRLRSSPPRDGMHHQAHNYLQVGCEAQHSLACKRKLDQLLEVRARRLTFILTLLLLEQACVLQRPAEQGPN